MKHTQTFLLRGLCLGGLSLGLLAGHPSGACAASSYRPAPQGIEVPDDMERYDAAVLQITFGAQTEPGAADSSWQLSDVEEPDADTLFDPVRLPTADSGNRDESPTASEPEALIESPTGVNVPEPGTLALLGLGLAGLLFAYRKKHSRSR